MSVRPLDPFAVSLKGINLVEAEKVLESEPLPAQSLVERQETQKIRSRAINNLSSCTSSTGVCAVPNCYAGQRSDLAP